MAKEMAKEASVIAAKREEGGVFFDLDSGIETIGELRSKIEEETGWQLSQYLVAFVHAEATQLSEIGIGDGTKIHLAFSGGEEAWLRNDINFDTSEDFSESNSGFPKGRLGKHLLPLFTVSEDGKQISSPAGAAVVKGVQEVITKSDWPVGDLNLDLRDPKKVFELPPPTNMKLRVALAWDTLKKMVVMLGLHVDKFDSNPFSKLRNELIQAQTSTLGFSLPPYFTLWRQNPLIQLEENEGKSFEELGVNDGDTILLCSTPLI